MSAKLCDLPAQGLPWLPLTGAVAQADTLPANLSAQTSVRTKQPGLLEADACTSELHLDNTLLETSASKQPVFLQFCKSRLLMATLDPDAGLYRPEMDGMSFSRGDVTDLRRADASEVLSILLPRVSPRRTSKHEELSACCQADSSYGTDV